MDTVHDIKKQVDKDPIFKFVPKNLLEKVVGDMGKDTNGRLVETFVYVVAEHVEAEHYHVYASSMAKGIRSKHTFIHEDDSRDLVLRSSKLNELQMQFRPDWKGERQEPQVFEAESLEEMLSLLKEAGRLEDFLELYPGTKLPKVIEKVVTKKPTTPNGIPSDFMAPITTNGLTKQGKIPSAKRKALVKRFGEKNIQDMEKRIREKGSN